MREILPIGEVVRLLGVTTETVRHYHKVGLLAEPRRSAGGYRLYTAADLLRPYRPPHIHRSPHPSPEGRPRMW
ncbi:MAG TPA: MerR family DNA-binding transcriptional regulator, partial [Thermomicrobiales bacterium]|nr:MerR family DNA-binding transcriptional regulator [Thermomicrobiales bacterium]